MLLKITHLPYVASIWAYENICRHMNHGRDSWRSKSQRPLLKKGPLVPLSRKHRFPALINRSELPLARTPNTDVRPNAAAELLELKRMISRLNTQVEELTLRIDRQRSGDG